MNVVPTSITTTLDDGSVSVVQKDYDAGFSFTSIWGGTYTGIYGKIIAEREYDYGKGSQGPLLRQTKTSYVALNSSSNSYLTNNLLNLPYSVQVLNGSGSQVSYSQYGYDETALGNSQITSQQQHDTSPPDGSSRGNQTSVQRWLNSGSLTCPSGQSAGSGSNVISKTTYFDTGTVQTSADPCGNTTTYAYSTTFWGAFPTQVTNPLSQPTLHNYDFNTGLTLSTTDPNLLVTSYTYDVMRRLLQASYPDGGLETVSYQESAYPFTATTTKKINTAQTESKTVIYDGLGRVTAT